MSGAYQRRIYRFHAEGSYEYWNEWCPSFDECSGGYESGQFQIADNAIAFSPLTPSIEGERSFAYSIEPDAIGAPTLRLLTPAGVDVFTGRDAEVRSGSAAFDRSFALSSSSALALGFSSIVGAWKGDDATAVDQAERAIRLSPFDPLLYLPYVGLAYAYFAAGRFAEAADAAGRASQSNPRFTMPHVLHAAALANLGHADEARAVADRLREVEPNLTVSTAIRSARFANPNKNAELGDALRRAGVPE